MQTVRMLLLLGPLMPLGTGLCPLRTVCPCSGTSPWQLLELLGEGRVCRAPVSGSHGLRRGK